MIQRLLLVVMVLNLAVVPDAEAQKNCRKGKPCGNTCIAANKTCRIGTAAPAPDPTPAVPLPATATDTATPELATAGVLPSTAAAAPWVGSSRGRTYYRRGCSQAGRLAPQNLIYFQTEAEAQRAGYQRSRSRGC